MLIISALSLLFCAASSAGTGSIGSSDADRWWLEVERGKELMEARELQDAREILEDALKELEKLYGKQSTELVPAINILAIINGRLRHSRQQMKLYQRALKLVAKRHGRTSVQYADLSYEGAYHLLQYSRKYKTGVSMLQGALDVYAGLTDYSDPMSARTALALGETVLQSEHFDAAQYLFKRALQRFDDDRFVLAEDWLRAHAGLVSAYVLGGKSDLASESCGRVRYWTHSTIPDSPDINIIRVAPNYPWNLLANGEEGYVDLSFTVDRQGIVRSPRVINVNGHKSFVPAALRALCAFKYEPRLENGELVTVEGVKTRISFELAVH